MNKKVKSTNKGLVGLPEDIFNKKPTKTSDFRYSRKLNYFEEPQNIIEELNGVYKNIINLFKVIEVKN